MILSSATRQPFTRQELVFSKVTAFVVPTAGDTGAACDAAFRVDAEGGACVVTLTVVLAPGDFRFFERELDPLSPALKVEVPGIGSRGGTVVAPLLRVLCELALSVSTAALPE